MRARPPIFALLAHLLFFVGQASATTFTDILIDANAAWVDTGIAIEVGDVLEMTATGSASPHQPNAIPNFDGPDGDGGDCATCIAPLPNSRYALVGRIGVAGGNEFVVGSSYSGVAAQAGNLFLAYNDDFYGDNAGSFLVSGSVITCGDGLIEGSEQCDDGNLTDNDGCSSLCEVDDGYACEGEPSRCVELVPQTAKQQQCINNMNKVAWFVAKKQGHNNQDCIRLAAKGRLDKAGAETAQGCLFADPHGAVQRRIEKLFKVEAAWCLSSIDRMPDFGYSGSSAAGKAALLASLDLVADLFGDPDLALVLKKLDPAGAKCQRMAHKYTQGLFDALWRATRKGKQKAFKDDPELGAASELRLAILGYLGADEKGRLGGATDRLWDETADACTDSESAGDLAALFPGACSSADTASLAVCAEESARCRFCESLKTIDRLTLDCDEFDNGALDASCGLD
jgi:cysteine-rich repeat protein